jgi:flagellar hook-associated protein 2
MGLSPLTFTGISKYSGDFQTILTRVTTIASFPLEQLKNEQSDITQKAQLSNELNETVKVFQEKLTALATAADDKAIRASTSNSAKLSVDSVNTDLATAYSITEVTSLATAAAETSLNSFASSSATNVSASGSLSLTVGADTYNFTLAAPENSLVGLRDKINSLGAGVTATILTVSPTENYLSVTANGTGQRTLSLTEDPTGTPSNFLSSTNQGTNLSFKLNGVSVSRTSNQVNDLIPGVSFTLKGTTSGSESLGITLASDRSAISSPLEEFVESYNTLQTKVGAQVGFSAGLLSGDILVREAQDVLRRTASFGSASGALQNWSDLGVTFTQSGEMTFDKSQFDALADSDLNDVFRFFASEDGLGELNERLSAFTDEVTGLAKVAIDQYERTNQRLNDQIAEMTERVSVLRDSYMQKLQFADALLGRLEGQESIVDASIQSLNLSLYGKNQD